MYIQLCAGEVVYSLTLCYYFWYYRESAAAYVMKDLLDERALLSVYDPQVTREQMMMEFDYTLGLNESSLPGMDKMITTCSSVVEAVKVQYSIAYMNNLPSPCWIVI